MSIPAGLARIGSNDAYPEEAPVRTVSVSALRMDAYEVTNRAFKAFVDATGYITVAERAPDPLLHPDLPQGALVAGSAVFDTKAMARSGSWWTFSAGANWRRPEGPGSSIEQRMSHPVVHIAYADALAYAAWKGGDLPTEAEWEYAARGGKVDAVYEWGDDAPDEGPVRANTWQGAFPIENSARDGFKGSSPVGCFPPNGYGLHDMTGNAWEWVKDSGEGDGGNWGVIKGGSYLCAPNYCRRYRPSARQAQERDFSASHIGFRLVYREPD